MRHNVALQTGYLATDTPSQIATARSVQFPYFPMKGPFGELMEDFEHYSNLYQKKVSGGANEFYTKGKKCTCVNLTNCMLGRDASLWNKTLLSASNVKPLNADPDQLLLLYMRWNSWEERNSPWKQRVEEAIEFGLCDAMGPDNFTKICKKAGLAKGSRLAALQPRKDRSAGR